MNSDLENCGCIGGGGRSSAGATRNQRYWTFKELSGQREEMEPKTVLTQREAGDLTSNAEVECTLRRIVGQLRVVKYSLEANV